MRYCATLIPQSLAAMHINKQRFPGHWRIMWIYAICIHLSQGPWAPTKTNKIYQQHISSDFNIKQLYERLPQNDWTIKQSDQNGHGPEKHRRIDKVHKYKIPPLECSLELHRNVALNYGRSKCYPNTRLYRVKNKRLMTIHKLQTNLIHLHKTYSHLNRRRVCLQSPQFNQAVGKWFDMTRHRHLPAASGSIWQLFPVLGSHGLPAVPDVLADAGEDIGTSTSGALDECSHLSKAEECQVALSVEIHPCKVSEDKVNPLLQSCQTCCTYPEMLAVSRREAFNLLN